VVQHPQDNQPIYSYVVPVERLTGRASEELMAFGASAQGARSQAERMLADDYGCDAEGIQQLLAQARVECLTPWCSPDGG